MTSVNYYIYTYTLVVKFVSLFPDSPSFPETLWGGRKGGREGGGEGDGLVGLLLAKLVADVVLADLLNDVLHAGLLALLLGALTSQVPLAFKLGIGVLDKFSSALQSPLQSAPRAVSTQVHPSSCLSSPLLASSDQ